MPSGLPGVAGGTGQTPLSEADALAGLQYDAQINALKDQQAQGTNQAAQNQGDISHWYDAVLGAQGTAAQRDHAAAEASKGTLSSEIQGIINSLGGGANEGAGMVGSAGASALGLLGANEQAGDQYNTDLAPLLHEESAGQHRAQKARDDQAAVQLANQLLELQGARGQAKVKALGDIRQQNFGNRLAVQNANAAAASLGINIAQAKSGIAHQRNADKLAREQLQDEIRANKVKLGLDAHAPAWKQLTPDDRNHVINTALQQALAQYTPKGGGSITNWKGVSNAVRELLRGAGYASARGRHFKGRIPDRGAQSQILNLIDNAIRTAQAQQH